MPVIMAALGAIAADAAIGYAASVSMTRIAEQATYIGGRIVQFSIRAQVPGGQRGETIKRAVTVKMASTADQSIARVGIQTDIKSHATGQRQLQGRPRLTRKITREEHIQATGAAVTSAATGLAQRKVLRETVDRIAPIYVKLGFMVIEHIAGNAMEAYIRRELERPGGPF